MTIYALSTAHGVSGLAVIRVSGHLALTALKTLTRKSHFKANVMTRAGFHEPQSGKLIDKGLCVYFAKPKSFTGEDVVEIHVHGSQIVIDKILHSLGTIQNVRMAEPGEFSKQAFLNNKMDLTAIEAMGDLINAQTEAQLENALSQMGGKLSELYLSWRKTLIELVAYLEANIDFAEEDIPDDILNNIHSKIDKLITEMNEHLSQKNQGEILRDGYKVVIVGEPNVGKSSLLNLLADRDIAIVSDQAGTTRDALECRLNIAGFPVLITDTAGLRESDNEIEMKGIEITKKKIQESQLVIEMFDDPKKINSNNTSLKVLNKSDLHNGLNEDDEVINISVIKNEGIDKIINSISKNIQKNYDRNQNAVPTKTRYILGIQNSINSLEKSKNINPITHSELMVEELRYAINEVGRITGHVDVEDFLDVIFKDFCIGK